MNKVNQLSFAGETICCGLDAHLTNWKINLLMGGMEISRFSQNPDPELLYKHLQKNYPDAKFKVVYEAGFCGFGIQRSLTKLGVECIVVNAADVPTSDKEHKRKDDKRDAAKLSRELSKGQLEQIYVPSIEMEHYRTLVRQRYRLVKDQTRCKNRVKHLLMFSGLAVTDPQQRWSKKYVEQLEALNCQTEALKIAVALVINEYKQIRDLLKQATLSIRKLSKQPPFSTIQSYLQSIDGVGLINGMVFQTEIQNIYRFKTFDQLSNYAGLVPDISSSNDKTVVKGVTKRRNEFLREALIESSWILIHKDPAMLMKYNEYTKRMKGSKAIIRIAKHLLSRISYVWKNQKKYERGIV